MSSTRSERADALTVLAFAVAALIVVAFSTALRAAGIFRDDGIAWSVPIDDQPIEATADSGAIALSGIAQHAVVFAKDVNALSVAAIIAALALSAVAAVAVIAAVALVAWNFLRGRIFVRANVGALNVIGWVLVLAPLAITFLEQIGLNGVLAALDLSGYGSGAFVDLGVIVPLFATGVAVGLVAVAFRRGVRLQKETEGLI